MTDAFPV